MSNAYINPISEIIIARADDSAYDLRDKVAGKFEGVSVPSSGSGTFGLYLRVQNGKVIYVPQISSAEFYITEGLYSAMSAGHWLYRLLCTLKLPVESHGTETGTMTWRVAIRHKASGIVFSMYDHKGGLSCGLYGDKTGKDGKGTAAFRRDLLALLNYLISDQCVHPYDGTIAGTCA